MKNLKHHISIITTILFTLKYSHTLPWTAPPLHSGHHFQFMWNAPSELCKVRFNMSLNLSHFHLQSSTLKTATNQPISIFYTDRFGLYPDIDNETDKDYSELPQEGNVTYHVEDAKGDIKNYIGSINQSGLAILDFEEWRPQWVRNWGSMNIYREWSIDLVKMKNASLSDDDAEDEAKRVFEDAAKTYFLRSINLGKELRPKKRWGYYLYPDCYNYDYNQDMEGFTGECPDIEKERNNNLLWLWNASTALYPSIYLEKVLRNSTQARMYVRHRIQEAMRVSTLPNSTYSIPIYPYIRPVYKDSVDDYMLERDLVNTIGEAAALGAAGVVSWGDMDISDDKKSCSDAGRHLEEVMNDYIRNVSWATQLCSKGLCQGLGRCVRKQWDSDVFLHLDPQRYPRDKMKRRGLLEVKREPSKDEVNWFDRWFDCMCYSEKPCRKPLRPNPAFTTQPNSAASQKMDTYVLLIMMLMSLNFI